MASSVSFVQYVCDQLSGAGEIRFKRMFGEYGLYCDGKFFAVVCDDSLFVKPTKAGAALLADPQYAEPYAGAKPSLLIQNLEDRELMTRLVETTCSELPAPRPRKKKDS